MANDHDASETRNPMPPGVGASTPDMQKARTAKPAVSFWANPSTLLRRVSDRLRGPPHSDQQLTTQQPGSALELTHPRPALQRRHGPESLRSGFMASARSGPDSRGSSQGRGQQRGTRLQSERAAHTSRSPLSVKDCSSCGSTGNPRFCGPLVHGADASGVGKEGVVRGARAAP